MEKCESCGNESDTLIPILVLLEEDVTEYIPITGTNTVRVVKTGTKELMGRRLYCPKCFYTRTNPFGCLATEDSLLTEGTRKILEKLDNG